MDDPQKTLNLNIPTSTIIKIVVTLIILWFLYLIKEVLAIVFVALILASAITPWIDRLERRKIPRSVSVILIYLVIVGIISLTVGLLIPPITEQVGQLAKNFPQYYEKIIIGFSSLRDYSVEQGLLDHLQENLAAIEKGLSRTAKGAFTTITSIFGGIFSLFIVLVITFYMVVEESAVKRIIRSLVPHHYQPYLAGLINRMQEKVGLWLRGQLILCVIVGLLSYIGLLILGVDYALVLALIAGLTEFIPYLGPMIGAVPAVFLAFLQSPVKALLVVILYVFIQQIENNILVPKIMQRAVGLNPIISIVVLMIGFRLGGVVGALLAIPVATALSVFIKDFFTVKEEGEA